MMNKDQAGGNWKQFRGKIKEQWGKLTDDDMTIIEGKREQLVGKIQERYGYQKEQAEKEVKSWEDSNKFHW
ncbi:CsbD family protein [Gibbsiella dentisursi]|uniref:CsbD family protein n=2 Tax=Yersiniaceae TaxID=1903411 RepID=A0ABP7LX16_9GAMM